MLASRFNPLFFCQNAYHLGLLTLCFALFAQPGELMAQISPEPQSLGAGVVASTFRVKAEGENSGYQFALLGSELIVEALGAEENLRSSPKVYHFPSAPDQLKVEFSVLQLESKEQVVVVTDLDSSYSFVFTTQRLPLQSQVSELRVQLALRGRLRNDTRQLRIFSNGQAIYLVDDAEPKVCGLRSSRLRKLDLQQARFRSVRRSPLTSSEKRATRPLPTLELKENARSWSSLRRDKLSAYSDGDYELSALPRQSQLYLGAEELAGQGLRLFFREKVSELYLNTGKELWLIPTSQGKEASRGRFSELKITLPEGDCFSLIIGKASPEISEIFVSVPAESSGNQAVQNLVNGYLRGQVAAERLTIKAPLVAARFLKLWPSLSSVERDLARDWAFRMHPSLGALLLVKAFTQDGGTQTSRYANWLTGSASAVELWLQHGLRQSSTARLAVLELTMPVALKATYSAMARTIARQPAGVRKGFRLLVWRSLDRPGARQAYLGLAQTNLKKMDLDSGVKTDEMRRGAVEWLRIAAQAPEISNLDYLPLLARLGQPKDFREAYVLLEGNVERFSSLSQPWAAEAKLPLEAIFRWSDLKLSGAQKVALHDKLFNELIANGLIQGRFLGTAVSRGSSEVRPVTFDGQALSSRKNAVRNRSSLELHWQALAAAGMNFKSPQLRGHIVEWWGMNHRAEELISLQELSRSDDWPQVRAAAIRALGQYPITEYFEERLESILVSLRRDPQLEVRRRAALALSRLPSESTTKALFRVMSRETETEVKAAAVRSLGKLCVDSAVDMLTAQALTLDSSPQEGAELKLSLASVSALYRLNPVDLKQRMNQLDLKKVPGPYQAGLRAARATAPRCNQVND